MDDPIAEGIVALGRRLAALGLVVASGGNLSARGRGRDELVVTPTGWSLDRLDPSVLATVTADGTVVRAVQSPTTELAIHLAAFTARPDVAVCVHLHPPMATLLHALDHPIRRMTTDHAYYLRRVGTLPYLHPGSTELADAVAAELAGVDIVLLRHHGCVVVGDSFDVAFSRAANLEAAAVATYRAHVFGGALNECPPEYITHVEAQERTGVVYGAGAVAVDESVEGS